MNSSQLVLDCNIFGLQIFGGISNYWGRLINYFHSESPELLKLVLPQNIKYLDFDERWFSDLAFSKEIMPPQLARYLGVSSMTSGGVFHTPYYRIPKYCVDKYVVSVHDFTYERMGSGLRRFIHSAQKFQSIKMADEIICVSESTKRDILEFCPWIDSARLHVIPHGIDHGVFYPDPIKLNIDLSKIVLFIGQRGGYKRFDLAVEALKAYPNLSLGIIGAPLKDSEKYFLKKNLDSRWHEFGPISTSFLRALYSSAYALIFPSDYEGFGLPIIEAMACGCPAVVSNLSSFPEVGGNAALYALRQSAESYMDCLSSLEIGGEFRQEIIERGIRRASQFQWIKSFQATRKIYCL